MTNWTPGRPGPSEYASHAGAYVNLVPGEDVLRAMAAQVGDTVSLLETLDENFAYAPGKWTAKQVLSHMIDTERIFSYRVLRLARNDATPLPGFEQNDYVANGPVNHLLFSDLTDEFVTLRKSTLALYRGLIPEAWKRTGTVSEQSVTVRGLIFTSAGHELHHAKILREKYSSVAFYAKQL